ncbi:hypothetical protein HKD37_18G052137 [Glycine soja]
MTRHMHGYKKFFAAEIKLNIHESQARQTGDKNFTFSSSSIRDGIVLKVSTKPSEKINKAHTPQHHHNLISSISVAKKQRKPQIKTIKGRKMKCQMWRAMRCCNTTVESVEYVLRSGVFCHLIYRHINCTLAIQLDFVSNS